ncbi:MAG: TetR/AcrR family transcriptional regulator [Anaerolineae bacterium]|nr:TetR/AcrR family transcriptional regulator [Anaerolineae bacterium]
MQQRSEETRERILSTALACFAEAGYDATGVAAICQRAGVSKGAFYHHFASKQALFLALLDEWLDAIDGQMATTRTTAASVPEGLTSMASMFGQVFRDASGKLPMMLQFWTQAAKDPLIWEATMAPFRRYHDLFAGIIAAGVAEGSLATTDPPAAARAIVALSVGMLLQGVLDPDATDWAQAADDGVRLLLAGLLRRDT